MSADADLHDFASNLGHRLETLRREDSATGQLDPHAMTDALDRLGALDLADDVDALDNPLEWLSAAVRTSARFSPSVAFALATRFAAQRVVPDQSAVTAAVAIEHGVARWRATVPVLFEPKAVVLLRRVDFQGRILPMEALDREPAQERTGLRDARLCSVVDQASVPAADGLSEEQVRAGLFELDVLIASVGMGLLEHVLATSEAYAANRRQFGQPVGSFAGLAAILVEMRLRVSSISGLLGAALGGHRDAELAAVTGRACVDTCLDAIQVHGGYGYIEEFPVAGLLRDAVSLRARGGGRRSATAALAATRLALTTANTTRNEAS